MTNKFTEAQKEKILKEMSTCNALRDDFAGVATFFWLSANYPDLSVQEALDLYQRALEQRCEASGVCMAQSEQKMQEEIQPEQVEQVTQATQAKEPGADDLIIRISDLSEDEVVYFHHEFIPLLFRLVNNFLKVGRFGFAERSMTSRLTEAQKKKIVKELITSDDLKRPDAFIYLIWLAEFYPDLSVKEALDLSQIALEQRCEALGVRPEVE